MMPPPFVLRRPERAPIPLLLDSPHSGTFYPEDFRASAPLAALRTAEDTHVEALFADAVQLGATLLCAHYPRAYIDCNRRIDDIDESLLDAAWPTTISPSDKTKLGYGLVWRRLDDGSDIYSRKLGVHEIQARIDRVYTPYWNALVHEADQLHRRFGVLYHLNCHSMPSHATCASHLPRGTPHADIVLGDRDGSTCDPAFVDALAKAFRAQGFSVKINDPYKGVEIVRALGRPRERQHSVQIELNRALYMNETTRERSGEFEALRALLDRALTRVISEVFSIDHKKLSSSENRTRPVLIGE
jgi:N-formylglutamate deformylase